MGAAHTGITCADRSAELAAACAARNAAILEWSPATAYIAARPSEGAFAAAAAASASCPAVSAADRTSCRSCFSCRFCRAIVDVCACSLDALSSDSVLVEKSAGRNPGRARARAGSRGRAPSGNGAGARAPADVFTLGRPAPPSPGASSAGALADASIGTPRRPSALRSRPDVRAPRRDRSGVNGSLASRCGSGSGAV